LSTTSILIKTYLFHFKPTWQPEFSKKLTLLSLPSSYPPDQIEIREYLRGASPLFFNLPLPLDKGKGIKGIGLPKEN